MANQLFNKAREGFLLGQIAWVSNDIRGILIDTGVYTPNFSTHQYLSSVTAGGRVAVSAALANRAGVDGYATANNLSFPLVTGATAEALILYQHTGTESTSRLIAWIDTAAGLPVTPNGGDINIGWDTGTNKIFRI